jgi:hypothetical protein
MDWRAKNYQLIVFSLIRQDLINLHRSTLQNISYFFGYLLCISSPTFINNNFFLFHVFSLHGKVVVPQVLLSTKFVQLQGIGHSQRHNLGGVESAQATG